MVLLHENQSKYNLIINDGETIPSSVLTVKSNTLQFKRKIEAVEDNEETVNVIRNRYCNGRKNRTPSI